MLLSFLCYPYPVIPHCARFVAFNYLLLFITIFIFSCISIFTVLFLRESFWSVAVYTFFIFQTPFSS
jgi:hypothetical protein